MLSGKRRGTSKRKAITNTNKMIVSKGAKTNFS